MSSLMSCIGSSVFISQYSIALMMKLQWLQGLANSNEDTPKSGWADEEAPYPLLSTKRKTRQPDPLWGKEFHSTEALVGLKLFVLVLKVGFVETNNRQLSSELYAAKLNDKTLPTFFSSSLPSSSYCARSLASSSAPKARYLFGREISKVNIDQIFLYNDVKVFNPNCMMVTK